MKKTYIKTQNFRLSAQVAWAMILSFFCFTLFVLLSFKSIINVSAQTQNEELKNSSDASLSGSYDDDPEFRYSADDDQTFPVDI